ncbi:hypothetical protein M413DRAFT_449919 [Hebeloma cylindrosporum]|uniref:Uncharacterized protein n=1 Tax=Hebeloma cylindrosporum TaxID=76867 RepID=A0A0C3BUI7_HEBCY|nr:hypothetical protein M413DRAFT_449919 [Hebeloma cylindrosporum h7]
MENEDCHLITEMRQEYDTGCDHTPGSIARDVGQYNPAGTISGFAELINSECGRIGA